MNLSNTMNIFAATEELRRPLSHETDRQKTVCIDFDGVLSASDGPYSRAHFGPPVPQGFKLLRGLLDNGYQVVVLTARKETDLITLWLSNHGFPNMVVTNHKVPAIAYIDDRAISFADDSDASNILKYVESPEEVLKLKS